MYNEDRKLAFIESYATNTSRANAIRSLFNATEPFEAGVDRDFCAFTKQEAGHVINAVTGIRIDSARTLVSILVKYNQWCAQQGYDTVPLKFDLKSEIDKSNIMRAKLFRSPEDLQSVLDILMDDPEEETMDCVYRTYFWMGFAGVPNEETVDITQEEVDLKKHVIRHDGKVYPIYPEAEVAIEKTCTLTIFYRKHPLYGIARMPRVEGTRVLRGVRGPYTSPSQIKNTISTKISKMPDDIDKSRIPVYNHIRMSGIFYRVYQYEKAGIAPNFSALVAEEIARKKLKLDGKNTPMAIANKYERDYEREYQMWKKAFGYDAGA